MEDLKKSEAVMDDWRKYLRSNGQPADIFEMIKTAIMVAASNHPMEFRINREKISKTLFSINCSEEENIGCMKVSDVNNHPDNYSTSNHDETEMEVLRIKEVLDRDRDESESESESVVIYELLSKLEQMGLSYKILDVTKIGTSVSGFQNHGSTYIRLIATRLIKMWRVVADEWFENQQEEEEKKQKEKEESIIKGASAEKKQTGMKKESSTSSRSNVVKIKIINTNSDIKEAKMEEKSSCINIEKKLEATKRKLHQRYEEVENAKRQRKIQVVELHQLKKQGLILPKTINQNRRSLKMW